MDKKELRAIVREELKKVAEGKGVELECQECGKKFRKANPTGNTKCPKCGSHDLELAEVKTESADRDYKDEYKKFQSSDKSKKYRAELNRYNRERGTYGNGDGKDASHKGGKIVGFEKESTNRGRHEKSRLKKEEHSRNVDMKKYMVEKFNAKILPAKVKDLEMKTLYVLIGSTAEGLLQKVKKNTGSNANPISLQIIKSLGTIRDMMAGQKDLTGLEALKFFTNVTNDHFDATAPGISSLVRKYKLKTDKYSGNVIVKEDNMKSNTETKIRELVRGVISKMSDKAEDNKSEQASVDESFISSYEPAIPEELDGPYGMKTRLKQREKDLKWWTELLNKTRKNSLLNSRAMQVDMAKKDIVALKKAIKDASKNESTEAPIEEGKSSKVVPVEKYGAAFTIMNGALMSVAMNRDGSLEAYDGELDWGDVTAPENQKFLDVMNKIFKTKFKMDDFAGR